MSNKPPTIKELEKEFDEKFLKNPYEEGIVYASGDELKQFYREKIKQIINYYENKND